MNSSSSPLWICSQCLRAQKLRGNRTRTQLKITNHSRNPFSTSTILRYEKPPEPDSSEKDGSRKENEQGALSRRLAEMAEHTMDTGTKSDRRLMQDAGFSEDLKKQLEERIAQTSFSAQHQQAASEVNLPSSAGKGTRDIASAQPWTGTESLPDAVLRQLDDSHKRLRTPSSFKPPRPSPVNLRPAPKSKLSPADRLAAARDKTSIYAISQQNDMSDAEKEKYRKELKERFTPGARPMPTSIQGLTSLANERIEDAIARGQFKNLPRGKGINVERDYNANSPFLDTTEYFMNKIIQKQEIVPPWIEKQQELVKAVASFRGRLRNDWKRHACRMISSRGGSVEDQVRRAKGYALAEERVNPRARKAGDAVGEQVRFSAIAEDGRLTTVTVEERIAQGVVEVDVDGLKEKAEEVEIKLIEQPAEEAPSLMQEALGTSPTPTSSTEIPSLDPTTLSSSPSSPPPSSNRPPPDEVLPMPTPFRDPLWLRTEQAYHTLAIKSLNDLTRSYNLMAPKIAQKPYYSLDRELNRCFADVAPLLPDEIRERARRPSKVRVEVVGHKEGGVLERFGGEGWRGHEGVIRDEGTGKGYGFREFWRDLFGGSKERRDVV